MFLLVALAIASAPIGGFLAAVFIIVAVIVPILALLSSNSGVSWRFEEEIVVRGAGEMLREILEALPKVFQALTLEEALPQVEDNRLQLKVKLTKAVTEKGGYSTLRTTSVDLGLVTIDTHFERREEDLIVKVSYAGNPPVEYAGLAADEYEKLVVAFRSAVNEALERVKPRTVISLDFTRLAELIASRGFVITAVRCPHCGGNVDLPKGGDTVKCSYCGTTLKAIKVYELIKKLIKKLA